MRHNNLKAIKPFFGRNLLKTLALYALLS